MNKGAGLEVGWKWLAVAQQQWVGSSSLNNGLSDVHISWAMHSQAGTVAGFVSRLARTNAVSLSEPCIIRSLVCSVLHFYSLPHSPSNKRYMIASVVTFLICQCGLTYNYYSSPVFSGLYSYHQHLKQVLQLNNHISCLYLLSEMTHAWPQWHRPRAWLVTAW